MIGRLKLNKADCFWQLGNGSSSISRKRDKECVELSKPLILLSKADEGVGRIT